MNTHTNEEVQLMAEYFGYKGIPSWIFMGALQEWKLNSKTVLENAKKWELEGKPSRKRQPPSTPLPEQGGDTSMVSYASWLLKDQCKKLLHMTSEEIAKVLDVSRPTVDVYLKNPSHMTVEKVDKLVHHLEAVKAMILTTEASDE